MPLYVYKCEECGHEFEDLIPYFKKNEPHPCTVCGKGSKRREVTTFGFSVKGNKGDTLVTDKEIDRAVGADAEKKWEWIKTRQGKRWKGFEQKTLETPKGKDGEFRPVTLLGDQKEKTLRKEFSEALTEHRASRKKKGEGQFDGPGAISDER